MKITNAGRGIHQREIPGIEKLRTLPDDWMAFTNLDLALSRGSREIDVVMLICDRILLVDLKDWRGKIKSEDGAWYQNGRYMDRSPVSKIHESARDVFQLLKKYLEERALREKKPKSSVIVPRLHGLVVLTGTKDMSDIAPTEVGSVYFIDDFIRMIKNTGDRIKTLGGAHPDIVANPLTSKENKFLFGQFFNVSTGFFRPGSRLYGNYRALSDFPSFSGPPTKVFTEFDVEEVDGTRSAGFLRQWDFTKAETRFQSEEGRSEIAGRERKVISWLNDRNPECETAVLQPKVDDPEKGVGYWEVFEKRRRLKRLSEFVPAEAGRLAVTDRIELARQILSRAQTLHSLDAAHLDIGAHSIWLESPSTVKLSHLMAASFPEVETLGNKRYQFLSSAKLPEDVLGGADTVKKRDVFLLGCVIHFLFFEAFPQSHIKDEPPEWSSDVDSKGEYAQLYSWFDTILSWDPERRFSDASEALDMFNRSVSVEVNGKKIIEGLENFGTIKSHLQLLKEYPLHREIRDDYSRAMWVSKRDEGSVLVKLWKRQAWGEQSKEAARILDFLESADSLVKSPVPGCVPIQRAVWLGDAIVLVQDWVEAPNLAEVVSKPEFWTEQREALVFLEHLIQRIISLHERGFAHGDLKPQNILVVGTEQREPLLIDLIDFAPEGDGEVYSSAYAPESGGRFERDRFAITKITEELLYLLSINAESITHAIEKCRLGPPENATVLPLLEAIQVCLQPKPETKSRVLSLSIVGAEKGPVLADEGVFGLRRSPDKSKLFIRGACEEIEIDFDASAKPRFGRRRKIDQKRIPSKERHEFAKIQATVEIIKSDINSFSGIEELLNDPAVATFWHTPEPAITDNVFEGDEDAAVGECSEEAVADRIADEIEKEAPSGPIPDIPVVWRRFLEVERDLTIEGIAAGDSVYNRDMKRHIVPFELESGVFDFDRDDKVLVERLDRRGQWVKIGFLEASLSDQVHIAPGPNQLRGDQPLVKEGHRLRFESHFEAVSRSRRDAATTRILSRESVRSDLIDVFDQRTGKMPMHEGLAIDTEAIQSKYQLNRVQANALVDLVNSRPVGLLQGPPGTGKTRFIGALVHFALTNGLANNVLLASQSHEAVNNAAEAVLTLFHGQDTVPSILRVGHESAVSDRLLPYHVARVEGLYKDRFRATLRSRLQIVGRHIGLSDDLIKNLIFIENTIKPVVDQIDFLTEENKDDTAKLARIISLQSTLAKQVSTLGIEENIWNEKGTDITQWLFETVIARHSVINPAQAERFRSVIRLTKDIIGSVSTRQRTLENFFAGTRQIVAGTCVGLGRSSLGLTETPFDLVVVDEAARCTSSELSVPVQAGRWIVLVGDQAQLEPLHPGDVLASVAHEVRLPLRELVKSDFQRVFDSRYGSAAGRRLTKQYRMLPPIGRIVSAVFYNNSLEHGREKPIINPSQLPEDLDRPLIWLTTDSIGQNAFQQRKIESGTSLFNTVEAELIVALLKRWNNYAPFGEWLESQKIYARPIGIICTYAAQRDLIRRKIRMANLNDILSKSINVDTVDSYQGKENPIVILSLVRNNIDGPMELGAATIRSGFMSRSNRINVALSRAMDRLVIVGAHTRWPQQGPVAHIASAFTREVNRGHARVIDAASLLGDLNASPVSKPRKKVASETEVK